MAKIIHKKVLKEAEANPLDHDVIELSFDEVYKQAILNVIGSESKAYNEYDQILSLEPKVAQKSLVELFHDTLVDIRDEEMKHIGQLTAKVNEVEEFKAAFEAGTKEAETGKEQEVKTGNESLTESLIVESLPETRTYDAETISMIIDANLSLTPEEFEIVEQMFGPADGELTALEADDRFSKLKDIFMWSEETVERLENTISQSKDPVVDRIEEFKLDIDTDILTIQELLDNVLCSATRNRLLAVIDSLNALSYNGEAEIGWKVSDNMYDTNNKFTKIIE